MPQAHSFLYSAPRRDYKRLPTPASPRDPEANLQLRIALQELGFEFGETILNFPADDVTFDLLPREQLREVELPFVDRNDILAATTRPPLSDGRQGDKKKIEPANTTIERMIFDHYFRYFRVCSRSHVELTEEAAALLPPAMKNRAIMTFYQEGCRYMYLQARGRPRSRRSPLGQRTAAFLLRVEEIWPGGPGLVAAWSLNAMATLSWCLQLRHRYSWMLENRGLTMVELHPERSPAHANSYAWVRDWRVTPVFDTGGELPPRPDEERRLPLAFD